LSTTCVCVVYIMAAEPNTEPPTTTATTAAAATAATKGTAGRTDYDKWHKLTNDLVGETEREEEAQTEEQKKALGLDGKYAHSKADAEERVKAKEVKQAKKILDHYQKREVSIKEYLTGLLGPVVVGAGAGGVKDDNNQEETKSDTPKIVRVTRDMIDAGKRVVALADTSGASVEDTIVLTSDLSLLESKMKVNALDMKPKEYAEDAQNDVAEDEDEEHRSVFGVIKGFIANVHNCTILVKCKFISGSLELSHCSNIKVVIEKDATVATLQVDLCQNVTIEFHDAASGKNPERGPKLYWGEDKEDRIFHAGVQNMHVKVIRDGYIETERLCDFKKDGAKAVGNAKEKEFQFVTSVMEEELVTEAIVREGATTGANARAMTQRELEAEKQNREKAAKVAVGMAENMIKFKEKDGAGSSKVEKKQATPEVKTAVVVEEEEEIEEVYGSISKDEIDAIVRECDKNKKRGNEAFGAGEYAQAILLYSLALDKADELPDVDEPLPAKTQLFPRDVVLSNRAACFLKLGQHEKAETDAEKATDINPANVKALFRRGLSLHAMKKYLAAIPVLAEAHKLEPKNKQIKEALQFAEVRMTQDQRKRME
jgi:tetratricopeptide (TPR) repeat protein